MAPHAPHLPAAVNPEVFPHHFHNIFPDEVEGVVPATLAQQFLWAEVGAPGAASEAAAAAAGPAAAGGASARPVVPVMSRRDLEPLEDASQPLLAGAEAAGPCAPAAACRACPAASPSRCRSGGGAAAAAGLCRCSRRPSLSAGAGGARGRTRETKLRSPKRWDPRAAAACGAAPAGACRCWPPSCRRRQCRPRARRRASGGP